RVDLSQPFVGAPTRFGLHGHGGSLDRRPVPPDRLPQGALASVLPGCVQAARRRVGPCVRLIRGPTEGARNWRSSSVWLRSVPEADCCIADLLLLEPRSRWV